MSDAGLDPVQEIHWLRGLDGMLTKNGSLEAMRDAVHFGQLKSVAAISDYGGEHAESEYRTYSFLFAAFEALQAWHDRILQLKASHFPDSRTIQY